MTARFVLVSHRGPYRLRAAPQGLKRERTIGGLATGTSALGGAAIRRRGGYAVGVGHRYVLAQANELVDSPEAVRTRLRALLQTE